MPAISIFQSGFLSSHRPIKRSDEETNLRGKNKEINHKSMHWCPARENAWKLTIGFGFADWIKMHHVYSEWLEQIVLTAASYQIQTQNQYKT